MAFDVALDGYEVIDVLDDSGGQATVYRGRQLAMGGRKVAIKVYRPLSTNVAARTRFLREIRAISQVSDHPNIVTAFDSGILTNKRPYLVMELCTGGSYADRLMSGPVQANEVVTVGAKISAALAAAHRAGVLHRDIKPSNILRTRHGEPVLADFGIAALINAANEVSGTIGLQTPAYSAPEILEGDAPTVTSDIYSVGVTLYALLDGRPPRFALHHSPNLAEIRRIRQLPVPDIAGISPSLMGVLRRALAINPNDRYQTSQELGDALIAVGQHGNTYRQPIRRASAAGLPPTRKFYGNLYRYDDWLPAHSFAPDRNYESGGGWRTHQLERQVRKFTHHPALANSRSIRVISRIMANWFQILVATVSAVAMLAGILVLGEGPWPYIVAIPMFLYAPLALTCLSADTNELNMDERVQRLLFVGIFECGLMIGLGVHVWRIAHGEHGNWSPVAWVVYTEIAFRISGAAFRSLASHLPKKTPISVDQVG